MVHTALLSAILDKANHIKNEYNSQHLCASHIAVAVADLCKTAYTGFCVSDATYLPCRFEEERLRYIFAKEVKLAAYFRTRLSLHTRNGVQEEAFDVALCERIAALRGAEILSSDVVFLCALQALPDAYKAALRSVGSDESILVLLQDTDENIYDYVVQHIQSVVAALRQKADEAAAIRDWKPAPKCMEPDALAALFFENIQKKSDNHILTLRFPRFFGTADLKVSIHRVDDVYYAQDNGYAIRHLARRLRDAAKCQRALKRVCHPCWIHKGAVTGSFTDSFRFMYYLQRLVFIAHADLYYTRAEQTLYAKDADYLYPGTHRAEPLDEAALLDTLKQSIHFCYDENQGLSYWLDTKYAGFSLRASCLIETLDGGHIRISDQRKGTTEGEIFEGFYWQEDDIAPYGKHISGIADRFGATFDGKDLYLTDKSEHIYRAMTRFFNAAVLLSEFGQVIALPTLRHKR
ncbi:MAG: hypothetical protein IJC33_06300 [Clostridia bacterium]|nr:hypothetical protein [Clostridia bacterium]